MKSATGQPLVFAPLPAAGPGYGVSGVSSDGLEPSDCRQDGLVLLLQEQGVD